MSEYTLHAGSSQFQREHSHYKNSVLIMSEEGEKNPEVHGLRTD